MKTCNKWNRIYLNCSKIIVARRVYPLKFPSRLHPPQHLFLEVADPDPSPSLIYPLSSIYFVWSGESHTLFSPFLVLSYRSKVENVSMYSLEFCLKKGGALINDSLYKIWHLNRLRTTFKRMVYHKTSIIPDQFMYTGTKIF